MGIRNALRSRILLKHPQIYISGCTCHILHNTSSKVAMAFSDITGFDVEDLAIDVACWLDKSTKQKAELQEFCAFCDTTFKEIVSHVSTRWLSLEKAINRILELYDSLVRNFNSTSEPQARFKQLNKDFQTH